MNHQRDLQVLPLNLVSPQISAQQQKFSQQAEAHVHFTCKYAFNRSRVLDWWFHISFVQAVHITSDHHKYTCNSEVRQILSSNSVRHNSLHPERSEMLNHIKYRER